MVTHVGLIAESEANRVGFEGVQPIHTPMDGVHIFASANTTYLVQGGVVSLNDAKEICNLHLTPLLKTHLNEGPRHVQPLVVYRIRITNPGQPIAEGVSPHDTSDALKHECPQPITAAIAPPQKAEKRGRTKDLQ